MAINFPNSPVDGSSYDFAGVRYTYNGTTTPGFWYIANPGSTAPATPTEINDGTNDSKYISSKGLLESLYLRGDLPEEILTALANVDGAGSGLDADKLDGTEATGFLRNLVVSGGVTDWNTLNSPGSYNIYNGATQANNPGITYGTLLVLGGGEVSQTFCTQIATDKSNSKSYIRTRSDSPYAWTAWKQLISTEDFASKSLSGTSGYQVMPGGMIMQWGNNAGDSISFPLEFPNAVKSVTATADQGILGVSRPATCQIATSTLSNAGVDIIRTLWNGSDFVAGTFSYRWIAVGY